MADRNLHTAEYLRQRIAYDPATGALTFLPRPLEDFPDERIWKGWNSRQVGKPAFAQKAAHGYLTGRLGGVNHYAHRIAWLIVHGEEPDCIDHINGDGWDNRLSNLRSVTHAENLRNSKRWKNNTSGVSGVRRAYNRWRVTIGGGGEVGTYDTLEEATMARKAAEREHGFHPNHGTEKAGPARLVSLRDDFARWREDPMTRTVLGALELAEKAQKAEWDEASWNGGMVRGDDLERHLLVLRTRADAYAALRDMTIDDLGQWLELDINAE